MRNGGMIAIGVALLTCTACLGSGGKLEIRSASSGLKAGDQAVPFRIAEAGRHLAMGNVALALEGFRKAAREDPSSVNALAGIAHCYDQIGRFDLSRQHYEMALAVAPRDPTVLQALAGSLEAQGLKDEAASVRRELAAVVSQEPDEEAIGRELAAQAAANAPDVASPVGPSVTIALPPPRPVGDTRSSTDKPEALQVAPVGRSVTIALPPARPATSVAGAAEQASSHRRPRLERVSLTEVALVTKGQIRWRPIERPAVRSAARTAPATPVDLRILNAARVDRLASRTRAYLGQFGWRSVAVGNAELVRARSLIVYPQSAKAAAGRLAARLGFQTAARNDVRQLTILLGRDAMSHPALRPSG